MVRGTVSNFKWIFSKGMQAMSRKGMFREIWMKVNAYYMLMAMVA